MDMNNRKTNSIYNIKTCIMKKLITGLLILTVFCFAECKKNKPDSNGLPAATQEGKNTLGFLLNGEPWKPEGFSGVGNLSIDYDQGFNNGILGIVAYRTISSSDKTQFILGIIDSLNFRNAPFTLIVKKKSIAALSFSTKKYCDILHVDTAIYQTGSITISKLDRINKIVSGTFEGILFKQMCGDTIKITNGRFDMKF